MQLVLDAELENSDLVSFQQILERFMEFTHEQVELNNE